MALRLDNLDQLGEKWQWRYRKQITWLGECDAVPYFIRQENGEFSTFDEDWRSLWQWWRTDARNSSGRKTGPGQYGLPKTNIAG